MNNSIYITGVGISSRFGNSIKEFFQALNQKEDPRHEKQWIGHKSNNKSEYEEAYYKMLAGAIQNTMLDAGIDRTNSNGCLVVGVGMGLADSFLLQANTETTYMSEIQKKLNQYTGMELKVILISNACCAGAQAITYAYDLLCTKKYEYVIAGGVEAYSYITDIGFQRLHCIDEQGCRPFDQNRKGISIGDGAAFFALQKKDNDHTYCKLLGHTVTSDAYHVVSPEPTGTYISAAITQLLERTQRKASEIDVVVAHGTGTKRNDAVEAAVLYDLFGSVAVTAPKGRIGHTGGASGGFGLLTAISILTYGEIPPIINLNQVDETFSIHCIQHNSMKKEVNLILVDCFAFGGTNIVFLCEVMKERKGNINGRTSI